MKHRNGQWKVSIFCNDDTFGCSCCHHIIDMKCDINKFTSYFQTQMHWKWKKQVKQEGVSQTQILKREESQQEAERLLYKGTHCTNDDANHEDYIKAILIRGIPLAKVDKISP